MISLARSLVWPPSFNHAPNLSNAEQITAVATCLTHIGARGLLAVGHERDERRNAIFREEIPCGLRQLQCRRSTTSQGDMALQERIELSTSPLANAAYDMKQRFDFIGFEASHKAPRPHFAHFLSVRKAAGRKTTSPSLVHALE
jgi:hypothetical protein